MAPRKYYRIEDGADGQADIMIYGPIGDSWLEESVTARRLVAEIRDLEKTHNRINVRINSPGGSVFDGLAIFNALQGSSAQIHTWNEGLAASMAAVILMAGQKVHAAKNSLMMLHSPSTGVWGNAREIRQALIALEKVQNSLVECMLARTDKTREEVEAAYFDYSDHWLSAEEALEECFIDEVVDPKGEMHLKVAAQDYQELVARFGELVPQEKRRSRLTGFFESLFQKQEINTTRDMDIKTLQAALSLGEAATEQDVLDSIRRLDAELKAEKAGKAELQKELEELRKQPGAAPAAVDAETDTLRTADGAGSFTDALAYCFQVLKK